MSSFHAGASTSPETTEMSRRWITWLGRNEETIRRVAILTVLYLIPTIWILQPVITDNDIWWHLQTGKWIVEQGTFPTTDPFSAYGEGRPWVAYSWLFEVGMYGLVRLFGESGIILYTLVLTWLIMLVLHRLIAARCDNFIVVVSLLTMSVVIMSKLIVPRTWLLTILFFAITLEVVLSLREGKTSRWFWFMPFLYVLWANTHIQFIYGLGLLGLAIVAPAIDHYFQTLTKTRPVMVWGSSSWRRLVVLTGLCGLATLITPYHVQMYSVVVELSAQTGMWEYLQEMQAPTFRFLGDWALLGFFSFVLVQLGRRASWSSFDVILLLVAVVCAFRGQRDVWFLLLACLAIAVPQYSQQSKKQRPILFPKHVGAASVCVLIGVVWMMAFLGFSETKIHENTGKLYPIQAAAFIEQQDHSGPLFNHFNWGGYLIWRLPHLKVSMDGRANIYGDERIKHALLTWGGNPHWNEDQELNNAGIVIAQRELPLTAILRVDPRFQVTYQDEIAVVFVKVRPFPVPASTLPPSTTANIASVQ